MYQIILKDVIKATEKQTFHEGTCSLCEFITDLYNDTLVLDIINLETNEQKTEHVKNLYYTPAGFIDQYVTNTPAFAQWLRQQTVPNVDDLPLVFEELCRKYQWHQADLDEIKHFWGTQQHQLTMNTQNPTNPTKHCNIYITDLPNPPGNIHFPENLPAGTYWAGNLKPVIANIYDDFLPIFLSLEYCDPHAWVGEAIDLWDITGFSSDNPVRGFYIGLWGRETLTGAAGVFYGLDNYVPRELLEQHGEFITVTSADTYKAMYNCERVSITDEHGHEVAGNGFAKPEDSVPLLV